MKLLIGSLFALLALCIAWDLGVSTVLAHVDRWHDRADYWLRYENIY